MRAEEPCWRDRIVLASDTGRRCGCAALAGQLRCLSAKMKVLRGRRIRK